MLGRHRRWFTADKRDTLTRPTCPICGREVVGNVGTHIAPGGVAARGYWAPTKEELIAHCPEHGHAPYNVAGAA